MVSFRDNGDHFRFCFEAVYHTIISPGALEYKSDGYVPTGERKQGLSGVGFRRKRGSLAVGILKKKLGLLGRKRPQIGGHSV